LREHHDEPPVGELIVHTPPHAGLDESLDRQRRGLTCHGESRFRADRDRPQLLLAIVEDDLWAIANYKETQLTHMKPGQPVDITIDSFPDHTFQGRVDSMSPGTGAQFALLPPDNATGNFTKIVQRVPVKIHFDRESIRGYERFIVPGMSVVSVIAVR
jgi:multidrug resistance efflux pump